MSLTDIAELSRRYGADPAFVLAGGGNTSYKTENHLFIKPSGIALADIRESDFVKLERKKVQAVFDLSTMKDPDQREATVKKVMSDAVAVDSAGRPSVEAPLHESIEYRYVVHLHPAMVNGMTCAKKGREHAAKLFPDALWVKYVDPGFSLASYVKDRITAYTRKNGKQPQVIFLQNHGVFVGADTLEEIENIYENMMDDLEYFYEQSSVYPELRFNGVLDHNLIGCTAPQLRTLLAPPNGKARQTIVSCESFNVAEGPLTPDHIVIAKSYALITSKPDKKNIAAFVRKHGYTPLVVSVPGKGVFCSGTTYKHALTVAKLAKDAALVRQLSEAFGGVNYLSAKNRKFIENWEVESYRSKIISSGSQGRLHGKIAVVTGGAQGFGYGIARGMAQHGATVIIADLNIEGANLAANTICRDFGQYQAIAVQVNIAEEDSVASMVSEITTRCGGIDVFIANAGVLKAGSVKEMSKKDWDFVTRVNYSGYFLCVKHVAPLMALQQKDNDIWSDIIQINSKSGLVGSNRNGAYAGSKFGTIGLTQSFALELISDKIKVNSICPGNYFEGPLWSDPEKGLFVQYLNSGKVPGAKSVEDVKKFYEAKIPMGRGCNPEDVVNAVLYIVEQKYETGQAIPVTGGQVMLS